MKRAHTAVPNKKKPIKHAQAIRPVPSAILRFPPLQASLEPYIHGSIVESVLLKNAPNLLPAHANRRVREQGAAENADGADAQLPELP